MAPSDEAMHARLVVRLTDEEAAKLRRVAGPIARALVAREAMMRGLAYFEKNPAELLKIEPRRGGPGPARGKRRRGAQE